MCWAPAKAATTFSQGPPSPGGRRQWVPLHQPQGQNPSTCDGAPTAPLKPPSPPTALLLLNVWGLRPTAPAPGAQATETGGAAVLMLKSLHFISIAAWMALSLLMATAGLFSRSDAHVLCASQSLLPPHRPAESASAETLSTSAL